MTATEVKATILAVLDDVERGVLALSVRSWPEELASQVRTAPITPAIAATAVSLPSSFPGDPAEPSGGLTIRAVAVTAECFRTQAAL